MKNIFNATAYLIVAMVLFSVSWLSGNDGNLSEFYNKGSNVKDKNIFLTADMDVNVSDENTTAFNNINLIKFNHITTVNSDINSNSGNVALNNRENINNSLFVNLNILKSSASSNKNDVINHHILNSLGSKVEIPHYGKGEISVLDTKLSVVIAIIVPTNKIVTAKAFIKAINNNTENVIISGHTTNMNNIKNIGFYVKPLFYSSAFNAYEFKNGDKKSIVLS